MLDWLIIGGGIHGTHLSRVLIGASGVAADRVRVLDPQDVPAATFFRFTQATGMTYLRSPAVHNLDLDPHALRRFAKRASGKRVARFVPPYDRPGLAFFRAHVDAVVKANGLGELRVRGRACALTRRGAALRVETEHGSLESKRVILAIGIGEQPCWPAWASSVSAHPDRVAHVFSPDFDASRLRGARRIAIVGGGITAGQLASSLACEGTAVTLFSRHAPRVHRFDSDPKWLGPRGLMPFAAEKSLTARRSLIAQARHRGSMPPEVAGRIASAVAMKRVTVVAEEITSAGITEGGVALTAASGARIEVDRLVFATGFEAHRPGGRFLDEAVDQMGLECAACGYPIVSPSLEWAPGLFVSGPLAELELGPAARNIAGARAAGTRLARSA